MRPGHRAAVLVEHGDGVAAQFDLVAVAQDDRFVGEAGERGNVGGEIAAPRPERGDQRAAVALGVQHVAVGFRQDRNRVGALEIVAERTDRIRGAGAAGHRPRDEPGNDLAVGLAEETAALPLQAPTEVAVVLDDAVMDDGHAVGHVRMRIDFARRSVRRPARMRDADAAGELLGVHAALELRHLAHGADPLQLVIVERGDAGRIVTAVLEALEPLNQDVGDRLVADRSKYSTHGFRDPW